MNIFLVWQCDGHEIFNLLLINTIVKEHPDEEIPILSSYKKGIEQGATFGPVADFYVLGKMAGEKAVAILKGQAKPKKLESELMSPPLWLGNKSAVKKMGIPMRPKIESAIL